MLSKRTRARVLTETPPGPPPAKDFFSYDKRRKHARVRMGKRGVYAILISALANREYRENEAARRRTKSFHGIVRNLVSPYRISNEPNKFKLQHAAVKTELRSP